SAHNEFVAGTTYTDTFSVASADGTLTSVTIHILGTNDAAVLSAVTQQVSETDLANATANALAPISSDLPSRAIFVGHAVSAHNEFVAGTTYTDTFSVASADGTLTSVTIHILGTNDAAVLSAITQPGSVAELANASAQDLAPISGTLPVSDLDVGDTFTGSISGTPTLVWSGGALTGTQITALTAAMVTGKLSFTAGASSNGGAQTIGYTYDASAANLDFLAAGQTLTVTYSVQVSDGTATSGTQSLSFVVTGTNDAPVLSTTVPTSVNVSGGVQVSSFLNSSDLDTSALSGIAITGTTTNGGGTWQYSTDGVTWTNFGAVSGSSSLLLTSSTRVRITGSGNSCTLTYRAWDQTSGTASVDGTGRVADTTTNGGTTAFSTASVTWSVSHPAGIAGSTINLALTDASTDPSDTITVTVTGVPSDWSLNAGTNNGDGSWTVQTSDPSALT